MDDFIKILQARLETIIEWSHDWLSREYTQRSPRPLPVHSSVLFNGFSHSLMTHGNTHGRLRKNDTLLPFLLRINNYSLSNSGITAWLQWYYIVFVCSSECLRILQLPHQYFPNHPINHFATLPRCLGVDLQRTKSHQVGLAAQRERERVGRRAAIASRMRRHYKPSPM